MFYVDQESGVTFFLEVLYENQEKSLIQITNIRGFNGFRFDLDFPDLSLRKKRWVSNDFFQREEVHLEPPSGYIMRNQRYTWRNSDYESPKTFTGAWIYDQTAEDEYRKFSYATIKRMGDKGEAYFRCFVPEANDNGAIPKHPNGSLTYWKVAFLLKIDDYDPESFLQCSHSKLRAEVTVNEHILFCDEFEKHTDIKWWYRRESDCEILLNVDTNWLLPQTRFEVFVYEGVKTLDEFRNAIETVFPYFSEDELKTIIEFTSPYIYKSSYILNFDN